MVRRRYDIIYDNDLPYRKLMENKSPEICEYTEKYA